jgi:formylglycine-generating enzyme required for sulfatase activity
MNMTSIIKKAGCFIFIVVFFFSSCTRSHQKVVQFTVRGITFEMIRVDSGTFVMGRTPEQPKIEVVSKSEEKHSELYGKEINYKNQDIPEITTYYEKKYQILPIDMEIPTHHVSLSSFYIGKIEVTQELWKAIMGSVPNVQNEGAKFPVTDISWGDCQKFIKKLNQITGKKFRLPTESEWEFAARGGNQTKHYIYSGSNNINIVAWYDRNAKGIIHEVGQKKANELGLYDMSGNAAEFTEDCRFGYLSADQVNPLCKSANENEAYKTVRGGSYLERPYLCRVSARDNILPVQWLSWRPAAIPKDKMVGFRLAMSLSDY